MEVYSKIWKKAVCIILAVVITITGVENTCPQVKVSAVYDDKVKFSWVEIADCTHRMITLDNFVLSKVCPSGADIYRAKIKANGKRSGFKKIGVCKKFKQGEYPEADNIWSWHCMYRDKTVKAGQAYVYKCRSFRKAGNVKEFQKKEILTRKIVAANAVGKYTCRIIENKKRKLVIKITGKSKYNGPLEYNFGHNLSIDKNSAWLVYKNEGEKESVELLFVCAYSYDGEKWYRKNKLKITGKESVYLRFTNDKKVMEMTDISKYKYKQMLIMRMKYNLSFSTGSEAPQMRLNLTTGEALVDDFVLWNSPTKWDGDVFEAEIPEGEWD